MAIDGGKRSRASAALPPRKLHVQKFAESRASELESLHSIVANRLNNDFRSRRNKRRRTTAYDNQIAKKRYRKRQKLGVIDKANASSSDKDQKRLPRRVRRRVELRENPENGFCTSGDGTRRLRTHVWHAKRFTMTKLWGFHLPLGLQGRGRGSRALLRWFKDGVLVHDSSYHIAVQLEGPEGSLVSILGKVMLPSLSAQSEDISHSILSGDVYGNAMLHYVGAPGSQPIAPVTYMWRPSHGRDGEKYGSDNAELQRIDGSFFRQLWVWIHASAFSEGFDVLKFACQEEMNQRGVMVNCFSLEGQLAKLELMGTKAFQLLQKTLCPITCNSENFWQLKKCSTMEAGQDSLIEKFSALDNEEHISSGAILCLTVKDPRSLPGKRSEDFPESVFSSIINDIAGDESKDHVTSAEISDKNEEPLSLSLSEPEGSSILSDNKNLWDASSGVSPPVEENILCMEKHNQHMEFICLDDPKSGMLKTPPEEEHLKSCPIFLLKNKNQKGSCIGWSLILPLSWVKVLWISFVSKGAHAIGLREKQWIACAVSLPYFPSHFPDCSAYSSFMAAEAAAFDQNAERRPLDVRPSRVPIPPPWDSVQVALDQGCGRVHDAQISSEKDMINGDSRSNGGNCDITSLECHGNSFNGVVARTSGVLIDFLNKINGYRLPLFPQNPNYKTSFLKVLHNESNPGCCQSGITEINYNQRLCFLRVLLHAYKEGVFQEGAVVCAPRRTDILLWTSSSRSTDGGLQMPQSYVTSYFKEQLPGKWELNLPEDPAVRESHRWPIGFVTAGFVRGSKKPVAVAFCEAVLLARLREEQWNDVPVKKRGKQIYVLVRNLRSSAYRLALATIVLEQHEEDVDFL